jgi:hypothetical protein
VTSVRRVPSRRALVWLAGGLVVCGVVALVVWLALLRDTGEPVAIEDVLAEARGSPVLVYETAGFEETDALFGERHEYPARTTISITSSGACNLLRWDALRERSTTWEICRAGDGWALSGYVEVHRFFGQTERTSYRCEPGSAWVPAAPVAGAALERRCSSADTTELSRSGRVTDVSDEAVDIDLELELAGRTRGSGRFAASLRRSDGVPLQLSLVNDNRSSSPIGDVGYREEARLELTS